MNKFFIYLIIFLFVFSITTTCYCEDNKARVYFGNGMLNKEKDATDSLSALQVALELKIQGTDLEGIIAYDISHNPTGGKLEDFFESVLQILDIKSSQFWRFLAGLDLMPDSVQEEYKRISAQIDRALIADYDSISKHVKEYNKRLCSGDIVLIVAHSQGNLYANIAYTGIEENVIDGFGIVSVANKESVL